MGGETPEFSITVAQNDIDLEREKGENLDGYLESLVIYRKLCKNW